MSHRDNRSYPELEGPFPPPCTAMPCYTTKVEMGQVPVAPWEREAFPKSPLHPSTSMLGNLCVHPGLHKQPVVQPHCHTLQHKEVTARVSEKCEHLPPRVPSTAFLPAYGKKSAVGHCWDREDTFETPATAQVSLWLSWCR